MPKVDFEWVKSQLSRARIQQSPGDAAIRLLQAWNSILFSNKAQEREALEIFNKLARKELLIPDDEGAWTPASSGQLLKPGDTVRVKLDAYKGDLGRIHNGRIGKVVAKRWGDIIVKHTDGLKPSRDDARYPASVLEVKR